ncbi:metallophosphoesterase family protein [Kumtagia ephedrae]|uniref:Metallophosphoesterase n=1 Tax=Kumtagia ephedrae TaxID=2116701 RepID=A0A2P7SDR8_9HYPH|nr:metallophosphoesterase family protein [Mesorhizobium ephedrae]PSJ60495.1 metallophosphoesterase [Mesorhizobium ephedrae]
MRIAVIADIHGNILALEAVLADLARRGGADLTVNLGDCASGPLWPRETVGRLMSLAWPTVRGNHDRRVPLDPLDAMGPSDRFAHDRLSQAQRDWLAGLPLQVSPAPSILAFHARPDHDEKYLTENIVDGSLVRAPMATIARRLEGLDPAVRLVLAGHSHRPELVELPGGPIVFNPGSVGCPAYFDPAEPAHRSEQGSPHARYGLVETDGKDFSFQAIAVRYDHEAAAKHAAEAGRPEWAEGLRTGFISGEA